MTAPSSSGGRSPLWIAGVALIGVGVLSGVVGLIGLGGGSGNGEEGASAAPPSSSAPASPDPGTATPPGDGTAGGGTAGGAPGAPGTPGAPGGAGTSPFTPGAPGTPGAIGSPGGGSGGQPVADGGRAAGSGGGSAGAGVPAASRPVVRVYNNSTIKGLAEKAAEEFRRNGWTVAAVQNYPQGIIPATTVYYRPGTAEKAAADQMAATWGMRSEPRFQGIQDATPGIIVIITKDFKAA